MAAWSIARKFQLAEPRENNLLPDAALVSLRARRFVGQMLDLVALPEILQRGCRALIMALAHRIAALVDFALEFLGGLASGLHRPVGIGADGKAALTPLRAIIDHEGSWRRPT